MLKKNIFRTDKGNYEAGGNEEFEQDWWYQCESDGFDRSGDDNIVIFILKGGAIRIGYK